jgi:uncharacterized protein YjbI with pentapeptide repeats
MPTRRPVSFLKTFNASAPITGIAGEISVNPDTGRVVAYDGATSGGKPHALLTDLSDLALLNYPAGSLLANVGVVAGAPSFVSIASIGGGSSELGSPLTGRQIGIEDEEANALAVAPLTRSALATNNTARIARWRDARRVQAITRLVNTVGTYTFDVQGYGAAAFNQTSCSVTIGAAEPNDITIANLVGSLNAVVGRNYLAASTGTIGAKVCTLTTVAGSTVVVYPSSLTVFGLDANTENAILDLRSLRTIPFNKITGQASAFCLSGLDTAVRRAVLGTTQIFGTRWRTKLVAIGTGLGTFSTIELIDGAQGLYLADLEVSQDEIYPWQYVTITRPLGTPGTYNLTVQGTGPGAFGPTVVPITIGVAEPNDTTIANIVTALNGVAGNNYLATIAGTAPNTYCSVINDVSALARYTIVSTDPTILLATDASERQIHGLRIKNAVGASRSTRNVLLERVDFRATVGAGINMLGEPDKLVEYVYLNDCTFDGANPRIGLGLGARSCIELQRGVAHVYVNACTGINAQNSVLDCELTGSTTFSDYAQCNITFTDCVFSNVGGTTTSLVGLGGSGYQTYAGVADPVGSQVAAVGDLYLRTAAAGALTTYKKTSGGVDSTGWVLAPLLTSACSIQNVSFTRCRFLEGAVSCLNLEQVRFTECDFNYVGGLNATVDAAMLGESLLVGRQQLNGLTLRGCRFQRGPNAPAGYLIDIAGNANGAGLTYRRPSNVLFDNVSVYNASLSAIGIVSDVAGLRICNSRFTMNRGAVDGGNDTAFIITGVNHDILDVDIYNNLFEAIGTYKWLYGLGFGFSTTGLRQSRNVRIVNNVYARALSTASSSACLALFDLSAPADALGSNHERNPIMIGNDGGDVQQLFRATGLAAGRIHAVVGGNLGRNCAKMLEATISPEGTVLNDGTGVIGLAGDRYTKQTAGTTTEFWRKATTNAANVPDNKGWVQENVGVTVLEPLVDPLAAFVVVDNYKSTSAFSDTNSGTAAATAIGAGTITRGGKVVATTGTTATGRTTRNMAMSGGTAIVFSPTSGVYVYKMLAWACPVLSDGTEQHNVRIGFNDSITGDGADGAWFEFDAFANANVLCKTSQNSTRTINTSTFAPVAGEEYDFKITVTADTSVVFQYRLSNTAASGNWTTLFTHTTNIPTGTARAMSCGHSLIKVAGVTARTNEYQSQVIYQIPA